jgi:hypothetical protein
MTCLFGLAGWRQNLNPDYPELAPALIVSETGLYFQDVHPLVCIENLDQALKNYDAYVYPDYATAAAYVIGDRIRYPVDAKVYEAVNDIAIAPGLLAPGDWEEVNLFSQKVEALTRAAVNKVGSAMFTQKKLDGVTKSIFENVQLFSGVGDLMNKEVKQGRFVGFEIRVKNQRDIAILIQRIGTQFSAANPTFKLWLFNSSQLEPVTSITLNLPRANAFTWTASTLQLKHLSEQMIPGGVYYLGYYEDDLLGSAINKGYNFGTIPCGSCNNDLALYSQWTRFIEVTPFNVPAAYLVDNLPTDPGGPFLWNINANQYEYQKNYGLNLDLTTACDVTDFLCREKRLFTDAIYYQVAHDVLTELAYNTRNNTIAKEVRELAIYALNDVDKKQGIQTKLDNAIKAVTFDFSTLDDLCFPCNNRNGLEWGAM